MTLKSNSNASHTYAKRHGKDFDLSYMLSVQGKTRLTKTPAFILFDTMWSYIKNRPANNNSNFKK